jgi:hypothetical protein
MSELPALLRAEAKRLENACDWDKPERRGYVGLALACQALALQLEAEAWEGVANL